MPKSSYSEQPLSNKPPELFVFTGNKFEILPGESRPGRTILNYRLGQGGGHFIGRNDGRKLSVQTGETDIVHKIGWVC